MPRKKTSKNRTKRDPDGQSLSQVLNDYCRNTSAHGFHYWVSAGSNIERLFWVAVVMSGFVIASTMVSSVIAHWNLNPTEVTVKGPIIYDVRTTFRFLNPPTVPVQKIYCL